jgi:hypothetical protein
LKFFFYYVRKKGKYPGKRTSMDKRSNIGFFKKKRCPVRFMLLLFSFLFFVLSLALKSNLYASLYPKRYTYPYRQEDLKIRFQHLSLDDGYCHL